MLRPPPWLLLLPLLLLLLASRPARPAAAPDPSPRPGPRPLSPAAPAAAGVAGGAGGAELAALSEREDAPADGSQGLGLATEAGSGLGSGTIREALMGGAVVEADGPAAPSSTPGGFRTGSRCAGPQECIRPGLCPSAEVDVLFECSFGKVCCVPQQATSRPPPPSSSPPQQLQQEWTQQQPQQPLSQVHQHQLIRPQQLQPSQPRPQQPQHAATTPQPPRPQPHPLPHPPPPSHPHPPGQATAAPPRPQDQHASRVTSKPGPAGPPPPASHAPHAALPDTEVCGKVLTENRITNGKIASMGQFPWMALLGYSRRGNANVTFLCGGTLINERYVLTAAHCFTPQNRPSLVRLGEYNLTEAVDCDHNKVCAPTPLDIGVEGIAIHPDFDFGNIKNDIALIRLQRSVTEYSDFVRPICLPIGINVTDERKFKIAGWGKTDFKDAGGSAVLQFTDVNGVAHAACNELQPPELQPLEPGQLCAGGDKGKDACKGDSGGPLMVTLATNAPADASPSHVTYQIGVVSYGPDSPCGTVPLPSIYTRVAAYVPWILATIRP